MKAVALTQEDGTVAYVNPEQVTVVLVKTRKVSSTNVEPYAKVVLTSGGYLEIAGPAYDVVKKLSNG